MILVDSDVLISIAAPVYLRRRGELTRKNTVVFVLAMLCLLVPTVGSFYPLPSAHIPWEGPPSARITLRSCDATSPGSIDSGPARPRHLRHPLRPAGRY